MNGEDNKVAFPNVCSLRISHDMLYTGVWASRIIPKGKRFGPFVGERKKRSQVTSNVYMWEVRIRQHTQETSSA